MSREATGPESEYPFLFYGRGPGDWVEGANMAHGYEVRFRSAPDAKVRAAIARAFGAAVTEQRVVPAPKSLGVQSCREGAIVVAPGAREWFFGHRVPHSTPRGESTRTRLALDGPAGRVRARSSGIVERVAPHTDRVVG